MELAPTAWLEHSDELQSIIYGQSVLQHYRDAAAVATAAPLNPDEDAVFINRLVAQNPLNSAKSPFSLELCATLWRQMLPDPVSEVVLVPELKMQLLRQVKLYIDQSFRVLQSSLLASELVKPEKSVGGGETTAKVPTHSPTNSPTNSPKNSATNSPTNSAINSPTNSPSNSPSKSPSKSPVNTADLPLPNDEHPATSPILTESDHSPALSSETKLSNDATERITRRKSRSRRSRRSTPELDEGLVSEPVTGDPARSESSALPSNATADTLASPKRVGEPFEVGLETAVVLFMADPKFSFFVDFPPPTPAVKTEPVCLTAVLQAIKDRQLETVPAVQLELCRMVANAVIAEQIAPADARTLIYAIETELENVPVPSATSQPKKRRK